MEALVKGVDKGVAVVEVDVEGSLCDPGRGDHAVDAESGQTVLLGNCDPGVEQGLAGAAAAAGYRGGGHATSLDDRSVTRYDRPVSHVLGSRCADG